MKIKTDELLDVSERKLEEIITSICGNFSEAIIHPPKGKYSGVYKVEIDGETTAYIKRSNQLHNPFFILSESSSEIQSIFKEAVELKIYHPRTLVEMSLCPDSPEFSYLLMITPALQVIEILHDEFRQKKTQQDKIDDLLAPHGLTRSVDTYHDFNFGICQESGKLYFHDLHMIQVGDNSPLKWTR